MFSYIQTGIHRIAVYSENSKQNTSLLSLKANEFKSIVWIGKRDFIFKGKVYDCNYISASNGKINLACNTDIVETNLKNSLASNFDNGAKNTPASKSMKNIFKILPFFKNTIEKTDFSASNFLSFDFSLYSKLIPPSADLSLNSPPPETV